MSIDVETFAAWVSRPGATPAPTAGDPPAEPGEVRPWKPGGPSVITGYVDTTPANLGLDGDPVAHALHMLGQLDADQLAEVLAYYQPAPALKAVA